MKELELKEILRKHALWLKGEGGERAILSDADLSNSDLRDANLRNANLRNAYLRNADLRGANLRDANLRNANLGNANLRDADLRYTDLRNADLGNADLEDADLRFADLKKANLRNANLDYSVFPLWCGGIGWKVDSKLPKMLCAFICSMKCEDEETKKIQELLLPYARKSHRAKDILGDT